LKAAQVSLSHVALTAPGFPLAGTAEAVATVPTIKAVTVADALPNPLGRLVIPSINLKAPIAAVGLTLAGNMGVLNDPTKVGWYKNGAVPGATGSAVIDAHVFQAFAKLKNLKLGSSIYVARADGSQLRFVVSEIAVYAYNATEPLAKIFNRSDESRLNLITCYGKLTADRSTYDHRLVVYAELAS
jgi:LPXTG-site transpeptidase (sortase) family protein